MKANRPNTPPAFVPVTITLETQAEVDALHSILSHNSLGQAMLNEIFGAHAFVALQPFVSRDRDKIFNELCKHIRIE